MGLRNLAKRNLGVVRRPANYLPNPDLSVTLSDGEAHTAIPGRGEFVARHALRGRLLPAAA